MGYRFLSPLEEYSALNSFGVFPARKRKISLYFMASSKHASLTGQFAHISLFFSILSALFFV